ncbi:hypothetical protein Tco_0473435, partial [Tanacetum coccineum]
VVKCLNSNEYMEALGHAFGRAIEKGMQEGLAAGIEHGQAGRLETDITQKGEKQSQKRQNRARNGKV